jgi:hypothetical protein
MSLDESRRPIERTINGGSMASAGSSFNDENSLYNSVMSGGSPDMNKSLREREDQDEELAPLFFALASSFNVELVYIILKGITQFSYYNRQEFYMEKKRKKLLFT